MILRSGWQGQGQGQGQGLWGSGIHIDDYLWSVISGLNKL